MKESREVSRVALMNFLKDHPVKEFKPFARHIKNLNCIEILIRDCSICEKEVNDNISVLVDSQKNDVVGIILWNADIWIYYMGIYEFRYLLGNIEAMVVFDEQARKFVSKLYQINITIEKVE